MPLAAAFLIWFRVQDLAAQVADETGDLSAYPEAGLAELVGWHFEESLLDALLDAGIAVKKGRGIAIRGWKEWHSSLIRHRVACKDWRRLRASRKNLGDASKTSLEVEVEVEVEKEKKLPPTPSGGGVSLSSLLGLWNSHAAPAGLRTCRVASPERRRPLAARLAEHPERREVAWWDGYFAAIAARPWCRGENDRRWVADLDYALQSKTCVAYEEGKWNHTAQQADLLR